MSLPKSYNDITISQFQECYFILGQNPEIEQWITVLSLLSGVPEDFYYNLPTQKLKRKIYRLQFLLNPELNTKVKKYIYLNGRIYKAIYKASDLTTAQGIDIKEFQKPEEDQSIQDRIVENADKLLATIYLPITWKGFKYDSSKHERSANDFKKAKMGQVYGTLFFTLSCSRTWWKLLRTLEKKRSRR